MIQTSTGSETQRATQKAGTSLPESGWSEWLAESLCQFSERLRNEFRNCRTDDEIWLRCGELLSAFSGFTLLGRLHRTNSPESQWSYESIGKSGIRLEEADLPSLSQQCESLFGLHPTQHRFRLNDATSLILAPAVSDGLQRQILVAGMSPKAKDITFFTVAIQSAASAISNRLIELATERSEGDCIALAAVVEIVQRVQVARGMTAAAKQVSEELRRLLGCSLVVIGEAPRVGDSCQIISQAGDIPVNCRADFSNLAAAVMDESLLNGHAAQWPPADTNAPGLLVHRQLSERGSMSLVTVPLQSTAGGWEGSCLCAFAHNAVSNTHSPRDLSGAGAAVSLDRSRRLLALAGEPLATALAQQRSIEGRGIRRWARNLERSLSGKVRHLKLIAVIAVAALMLVPVPHTVECRCEVQPVQRRFVAPPFDAKLETAHVEAGDTVEEGQVIATLDGREVRWELAGLMADQGRLAKERDGHRAKHDFPAAALSELELKQNELKIKLLEYRRDNLEIRSPVNGLVLAGDLRKAEGMPLKIGQTLFEIAPPGGMILEAAVPEESLPYVSSGQSVNVRLESLPGRSLPGRLTRIDPQSERRYDDFAFVADVELPESPAELRPGMHGHCTIDVGRCRLGWRLFHRLWESVWLKMGW